MNSNFNPKISIIIPVYNGANYVGEAIESALTQTYKNFEVIVVNDGSSDNGETEKIALSYGNKIRYLKKENGGVSSALNYGISVMTGEYFSWLSHDDKYTPYKLEHLVDALSEIESRENLVALSGVFYIDSVSKKIKDNDEKILPRKLYDGIKVIEIILKFGTLDGCAMLIPKGAFDKCGWFNEDLRYNQDALKWYEIFSNGYLLLSDTQNKDVMYRLHGGQASKTRRDLLLRDTFETSKIIAPLFIKLSTEDINLLKLYAKRYAKYDCKDAIEECIRQGKDANIFTSFDVFELRCRLLLGKCRNILKKIYYRVVLRIK